MFLVQWHIATELKKNCQKKAALEVGQCNYYYISIILLYAWLFVLKITLTTHLTVIHNYSVPWQLSNSSYGTVFNFFYKQCRFTIRVWIT